MHILFVPSWYATPDSPLRGVFFREQALALSKAGHKVGLLVPPYRLRSRHGLAQLRHNWRRADDALLVEDDSGLPVYRMPWWGWAGSLLRAPRAEVGLAAFDRYCQEQGRPEIVHAHSLLYGGYLAAVFRARRGVPAIVTEHFSGYIRGRILPDQRPAIRFALQHIDRLAAVSDRLAASLEGYGASSPIAIVPNIVDTGFFQPAPPPPATPFSLALIAQLDANKAADLALRAFARAFDRQDARLTLAGGGRERPRLIRLAARLDLQDRVDFPGRLTREQVRDLVHRSHAIVSSSHVETFGITLIEAMACGRPVIATRSGGPDSFVNPTTGLLVPTRDADALAAAMRQMADTYARYDPAAIRTYCVETFSEAAFVARIERLYAEVIASRAASLAETPPR